MNVTELKFDKDMASENVMAGVKLREYWPTTLAWGRCQDGQKYHRPRRHLLHDALDFGQLFHQMLFVVEPAGRVDQDHVVVFCHSALNRVKGHGCRIGILALRHKIGARSFCPNRT